MPRTWVDTVTLERSLNTGHWPIVGIKTQLKRLLYERPCTWQRRTHMLYESRLCCETLAT